MSAIACLPMYDWPQERDAVDAIWARLAAALRAEGFDAPSSLTRSEDLDALWLSPDLLIGQTCIQPLRTRLAGKVRYVATPVHTAPGCRPGTYRSVIVMKRKSGADKPVPDGPSADLPPMAGLALAANGNDSMSGYVALMEDLGELGLAQPPGRLWTGSHRASIVAVAEGQADVAAIDCVSWQLALRHEPEARTLKVVGWTAERPALPLITALHRTDAELLRMRRAVQAAMPAVVLQDF